MQLDNGNSQASLAHARYKPHNQPYIVATSSHSDCKANEIVWIDWLLLRIIQHGKEKYVCLMPGTVQLNKVLTPTYVHRSSVS